VKKRWARPANFIGNLLSLYTVDPEDDKVHIHKADHSHSEAAPNAKSYEGEVEIDVDLKKIEPLMDVHFIGSSGEEEHFHEIELNLIPELFRLQPVPSRFSGLNLLLTRAGFFGRQAYIKKEGMMLLDAFAST
jgi:hypothetical protein